MAFKMRAFHRLFVVRHPSLSLPTSLCAWPSCFFFFFVSFSSVTDTVAAFFSALIIHRCCGWCGKGIFVQGIPGVTQIDGDLWESSLLRASRGRLWGGLWVGRGVKERIEGRDGGRGTAGHWRPATSTRLKNVRKWHRLAFIWGWERNRDIIIIQHTHTPPLGHTDTHT